MCLRYVSRISSLSRFPLKLISQKLIFEKETNYAFKIKLHFTNICVFYISSSFRTPNEENDLPYVFFVEDKKQSARSIRIPFRTDFEALKCASYF